MLYASTHMLNSASISSSSIAKALFRPSSIDTFSYLPLLGKRDFMKKAHTTGSLHLSRTGCPSHLPVRVALFS